MTNASSPQTTWIIDSACTSHMTYNRQSFSDCTLCTSTVHMGTDAKAHVAGRGTVHLTLRINQKTTLLKLRNVLHIPYFTCQLLSVPRMTSLGVHLSFNNNQFQVLQTGKMIETGTLQGDLYLLDTFPTPLPLPLSSAFSHAESSHTSNPTTTASLHALHRRFAHVDSSTIVNMTRKSIIQGVKITPETNNPSTCDGCLHGKTHHSPFPKSAHSATTSLLYLVHSDVCGPIQVPSMGGARYFISFVDDYSKWIFIYTMQRNSEAFGRIKTYHVYAKRHTGQKIASLNITDPHHAADKLKTLRTENGCEYLSSNFKSYLSDNGISHQLSIAHTPQQNVVAERLNRTLMDLVHSMLHDSNIGKNF